MTPEEFKNIVGGISDIISAVAIIIGGAWVLYKFGLFRERFPSMELYNNIVYIGENTTEYLFELSCTVENKGKVRKWLAPFDFDLLYLTNEDVFKPDPKHNDEVWFRSFFEGKPQILINKKFWVSPDWHIPFVDGEAKKRFHYLVAVPKSYAYLSLYTRFIDFNNRRKAIDYILSSINKSKERTDEDKESWQNVPIEKKLKVYMSVKSDFYYSQATVSILAAKKNSTQHQL